MHYLNQDQLDSKVDFIQSYIDAKNAADGSYLDANANVESKNISTLENEINKDIIIQLNRRLMTRKLTELYGSQVARKYLRQIEQHDIYIHDETSLKPYCASVSLYPMLLKGTMAVGGHSGVPSTTKEFSSCFLELMTILSSQFAGAIATVEFLAYFDYYLRKDYGSHYFQSHLSCVTDHLDLIVGTMNSPATSRGFQGVFWNISLYDKYFFKTIFDGFVFPDGSSPDYISISRLQKFFLKWFRKEREKHIYTFPVVTSAMLSDESEPKDKEFGELCAEELSRGSAFFIYMSKNADSLSSCCRLRNEITDFSFSHTLGAGGVATGSVLVITINMNRLIQKKHDLNELLDDIYKYHHGYRMILKDLETGGMLPAYSAGYITSKKQFSTIGINGIVEAAESLGIEVSNNSQYKNFVSDLLKNIYAKNRKASKDLDFLINTEFVPAENLGIKNAKWDKDDGLKVSRECYNSYLFKVEDETIDAYDKVVLHGREIGQYLDGGSALHLNLEEYLSKKQYMALFRLAASKGCNYFCTNVKISACDACGYIDRETVEKCKKCGSRQISYATRIIGYLKKISSFSIGRQTEHQHRLYHKSH